LFEVDEFGSVSWASLTATHTVYALPGVRPEIRYEPLACVTAEAVRVVPL
jgi:hypothetical protein